MVEYRHVQHHPQPRTRTLPLRLPPPRVRLHGLAVPDVRGERGARARGAQGRGTRGTLL